MHHSRTSYQDEDLKPSSEMQLRVSPWAALHHLPKPNSLDHEALHLVLQRPDLAHEIARFVRSNTARDHGPTDAACATERHLARHVDIRCILVLAKQWQM